MKAKVIKSFQYNGNKFQRNEVYEIKEHPYSLPKKDAIFIDGKWFCDIGSPIFKENFTLIK